MELQHQTQHMWKDIGGYYFTKYGGEEGKLQSANAVSALGAMAGFCAQVQARHMISHGKLPATKTALAEVETKDGRKFYLGDAINACLIQGSPKRPSFWDVMSAAGQHPEMIKGINLPEMIEHAAKTMGGPDFGVPRIRPEFGLTESPYEALLRHVSVLMKRFEEVGLEQDQLMISFGLAARSLVSFAAGEQPNVTPQPVLSRADCVWLMMESAIPMSKIDPRAAALK